METPNIEPIDFYEWYDWRKIRNWHLMVFEDHLQVALDTTYRAVLTDKVNRLFGYEL